MEKNWERFPKVFGGRVVFNDGLFYPIQYGKKSKRICKRPWWSLLPRRLLAWQAVWLCANQYWRSPLSWYNECCEHINFWKKFLKILFCNFKKEFFLLEIMIELLTISLWELPLKINYYEICKNWHFENWLKFFS